MQLDPATLVALAGGTGAGAVVDRLARRVIGHRREKVDVAKLSVEITAQVMAELRTELQSTRGELTATRAALASAHAEIEELRVALTVARSEVADARAEVVALRRITSPKPAAERGTI